jgi:hypothetical protein
MMSLNPKKTDWGPILILGSLWGLSEAALGMYLRQCASTVSGSFMTGAALFFLAAAWAVSPRFQAVTAMALLAIFFKLFDALLLGLPVIHGAVANPIFAIAVEAAAFFLVIRLIRGDLVQKIPGKGMAGALAALMAVNVFPLVKFASGIAACRVPGTAIPLSLYYAPIAVSLSALTVPLGSWLGAGIAAAETRLSPVGLARLRWLSPAFMALGLALLAGIRLI